MHATQVRKTALLALFCLLSTLSPYCYESLAAPISQSLKRSSSSINFGVDSPSPSLSMQGSFKDFSGELLLNPTKIESSKIKLSLNLASAQLPLINYCRRSSYKQRWLALSSTPVHLKVPR